MNQLRLFCDERQTSQCAYCGSATESRDHVPSRVLLDEPYPPNLPVVPACRTCNEGFSRDEEYVACAIECAVAGSAEPARVGRSNIRRLIGKKPALAARLAAAIRMSDQFQLTVEEDRVRNVVLKLARGHALFEQNEPQYGAPRRVAIYVLHLLPDDQRAEFERPPAATMWPEVGSRAMQRLASTERSVNWLVTQPGRYRYLTVAADGIVIRGVLSEYVGFEVLF